MSAKVIAVAKIYFCGRTGFVVADQEKPVWADDSDLHGLIVDELATEQPVLEVKTAIRMLNIVRSHYFQRSVDLIERTREMLFEGACKIGGVLYRCLLGITTL